MTDGEYAMKTWEWATEILGRDPSTLLGKKVHFKGTCKRVDDRLVWLGGTIIGYQIAPWGIEFETTFPPVTNSDLMKAHRRSLILSRGMGIWYLDFDREIRPASGDLISGEITVLD